MRREKIVEILQTSAAPVKGAELARLVQVSRQVVVQDIALLRAQGLDIMATPQGYIDVYKRQVLDRSGVGKLVEAAVKGARSVKPDITLGICGEPSSIEFCHMSGLTFVSCSPYRVPIARIACAQAAIKHPRA